jgi:transposase
MAKPLQETRRHQAAYELYYSLGDGRNCSEVARQFQVSHTAVRGWSLAFRWQKRVQERDDIVSKIAAQKSIKDVSEAKAFQLRLTRATMARWAQQLTDKTAQASVSASDFVKAAQHELLLLGKATSRSETVSSGAANAAAAALLSVIDRVCPERCSKCGAENGIKAALAAGIAQVIDKMSSPIEPNEGEGWKE